MTNTTEIVGGGVGFTGLLTILFIALKLTGFITWSWWWVLSPLLIGVGLSVSSVILLIVVALLGVLFGYSQR